MSNIIAAAGLILLRQNTATKQFEVLLLKRNAKLRVHGGNWVFPGGKVDAQDYQALNHIPSEIDLKNPPALSPSDYLKLMTQTAMRETLEEAGITINAAQPQYFSRWLTPKVLAKRFDTCFFIAQLSNKEVIVDGSEIVDYQWISPAKSLALHAQGKIAMPPATFVSLNCLNQFPKAQSAITELCKDPVHYRPKLISNQKGLCSLYEEDAAYQNENLLMTGKRHRLEMNAGHFNYISAYK